MRFMTQFAVTGRDRAEIIERAVKVYRSATGRADDELPFDAEIDMEPGASYGYGETIPEYWSAQITVRERVE